MLTRSWFSISKIGAKFVGLDKRKKPASITTTPNLMNAFPASYEKRTYIQRPTVTGELLPTTLLSQRLAAEQKPREQTEGAEIEQGSAVLSARCSTRRLNHT